MTSERRQKIEDVLAKRQNDLTIILENVFDPHNISAIMRSCDAVGVQEIYVLNTKIPRHADWGFKSSRSANKWITAYQFTNLQECVDEVRKKYKNIFTTNLTHNATNLYNVDFTNSIAIVFGNEQYGISAEMNAVADGNFIIPQVGMIKSLNVGVACAVSLYEAYRQKNNAGHYNQLKLDTKTCTTLRKEWGVYDI